MVGDDCRKQAYYNVFCNVAGREKTIQFCFVLQCFLHAFLAFGPEKLQFVKVFVMVLIGVFDMWKYQLFHWFYKVFAYAETPMNFALFSYGLRMLFGPGGPKSMVFCFVLQWFLIGVFVVGDDCRKQAYSFVFCNVAGREKTIQF